ncbi:transposase IS605 OrfB, partial [mine drainage metagenome]
KTNTRVANAVRSELLEALGHLGKRAGIAVVTVPARGTSANCPRCLAKLHHCPSPDRAGESGHKWSICRSCGLSADRDHAAAERIVSRGLAAQEHLVLDRSSGSFDCRNAIDVRVRRTLRPKRAGQGEQRSTHSSSFPPSPLDELGPRHSTSMWAGAPASGGDTPNGASFIGQRGDRNAKPSDP